jgi:hypothetical protein
MGMIVWKIVEKVRKTACQPRAATSECEMMDLRFLGL